MERYAHHKDRPFFDLEPAVCHVPLGVTGQSVRSVAAVLKDERQRLAARAPEVLERFGLEKVMGMWEDVLADVVQ